MTGPRPLAPLKIELNGLDSKGRAFTSKIGDVLLGWDDDERNVIKQLGRGFSDIYRVKMGHEWFEVDAYHLWATPLGWWPMHSLQRGDIVTNAAGGIITIDDVQLVGPGEYVKIGCVNRRYRMGEAVGHNFFTGT